MRYRSGSRGDRGFFSMIEMMVTSVILLLIVLGLIPLFSRAIRNNSSGSDVSLATSWKRSRIEEVLQLPFHSEVIEAPSGKLLREVDDFWARGSQVLGDSSEGWWPAVDANGTPPTGKGLILWERRLTTAQYSMHAFDKRNHDFTLTPAEREPGGTQPIFVHLKEIDVVLESEKRGLFFGGERRTVFRMLKLF